MIKVAFSIIMAFVLAGCSSRPVSMNYYLLYEPVQMSETQDITTWPSIELRSLSIPEYLKQRSLIVQLSPSELHFSPQHVWSEPVEQGVVQSLKDNLATNHKFRLQTQRLWTNSAQSGYILDISIDDFIPAYNGMVILRGTYRLGQSQQPGKIIEFAFQTPLEKDGFAHTVEKMRELVAKLANQIVTGIEAH